MRRLLIPIIALHLACPQPKPPAPPQPEPPITAVVNAFPPHAEVLYGGESIGQTPATVRVNSIDDLSSGFSASNMPQGVVEKRIRVIDANKVEVALVFDPELSNMAKALGLPKILVFDYGDDITFDLNSSEIKPAFKPLLVKQAEMLKEYFSGIDIHICGHSDSVGRYDHNMALSLDRAKSVFDELKSLGVPPHSLKMQGFGSDFPLVSNDTEEGRARNRRIEIILGQ